MKPKSSPCPSQNPIPSYLHQGRRSHLYHQIASQEEEPGNKKIYKKIRQKKVRKRSQKITKHPKQQLRQKLSLSLFAHKIPQDQFNHKHVDKKAYTHHEINGELLVLPSAIRCQLTGKKKIVHTNCEYTNQIGTIQKQ